MKTYGIKNIIDKRNSYEVTITIYEVVREQDEEYKRAAGKRVVVKIDKNPLTHKQIKEEVAQYVKENHEEIFS